MEKAKTRAASVAKLAAKLADLAAESNSVRKDIVSHCKDGVEEIATKIAAEFDEVQVAYDKTLLYKASGTSFLKIVRGDFVICINLAASYRRPKKCADGIDVQISWGNSRDNRPSPCGISFIKAGMSGYIRAPFVCNDVEFHKKHTEEDLEALHKFYNECLSAERLGEILTRVQEEFSSMFPHPVGYSKQILGKDFVGVWDVKVPVPLPVKLAKEDTFFV